VGLTDAQRAEIQGLLRPKARAAVVDPCGDAVQAHSYGPATAWQPASAARIRVVESAMAIGVMAYFASGLAKALGLF
jgi:hypothetical protein